MSRPLVSRQFALESVPRLSSKSCRSISIRVGLKWGSSSCKLSVKPERALLRCRLTVSVFAGPRQESQSEIQCAGTAFLQNCAGAAEQFGQPCVKFGFLSPDENLALLQAFERMRATQVFTLVGFVDGLS